MKYILAAIAAMVMSCYYVIWVECIKPKYKVHEEVTEPEEEYHAAICSTSVEVHWRKGFYKTNPDSFKVEHVEAEMQFKNGILHVEVEEDGAFLYGKTLVIFDKNHFPVIIDSLYKAYLFEDRHFRKDKKFLSFVYRIENLPLNFWEKNFNETMVYFMPYGEDIDLHINRDYSTKVKPLICKEIK